MALSSYTLFFLLEILPGSSSRRSKSLLVSSIVDLSKHSPVHKRSVSQANRVRRAKAETKRGEQKVKNTRKTTESYTGGSSHFTILCIIYSLLRPSACDPKIDLSASS